MLTISQLANAAGVTVRTVRHYHHMGLLPEPGRDHSGYRRYSAQTVVDLIRIKTLADAGVPLSRIDALLHAEPAEFAAAIADIDAELRSKMDQLAEHRRRIATLASGDRLVLPDGVIDNMNRMRAIGVSERTVQIERDHWILMQAMNPSAMPEWIEIKKASFDDPDTVKLYLRCDESLDWAPDDPEVEVFIEEMDAWEVAHGRDASDQADYQLLFTLLSEISPTWHRILTELAHRAQLRRKAAAGG